MPDTISEEIGPRLSSVSQQGCAWGQASQGRGAPLRGRAIAGARGWPEARIFALEMKPELVSISGVYRTSEEALPEAVWGHAATVRLQSTDVGDKLIFEPVKP